MMQPIPIHIRDNALGLIPYTPLKRIAVIFARKAHGNGMYALDCAGSGTLTHKLQDTYGGHVFE